MKHFKHDKEGYIAGGAWSRPFEIPKNQIHLGLRPFRAVSRGLDCVSQPSTFRRTIGASQSVNAWRGK